MAAESGQPWSEPAESALHKGFGRLRLVVDRPPQGQPIRCALLSRSFSFMTLRPIIGKCVPCCARWILVLSFLALGGALLAEGQVSITTYHYDNYRTGWNSQETALTPKAVSGPSFGVLKTIVLDDQVEAQPLVITGVNITAGKFKGTTHNVVYVATDNNSIYAIDMNSGAVLLKPNFGPPVVKPLSCHIYNPDVGINSTPVIDISSNTLYAIVYTQQSSGPAYFVHALDLGSLTDKVTPEAVTGSHTLTDGTTYSFNATYQRQRPALLLANGNVYAAFGSFCDKAPSLSRGWVLGWQTGTLTPLPGNQLLDTQASDMG